MATAASFAASPGAMSFSSATFVVSEANRYAAASLADADSVSIFESTLALLTAAVVETCSVAASVKPLRLNSLQNSSQVIARPIQS